MKLLKATLLYLVIQSPVFSQDADEKGFVNTSKTAENVEGGNIMRTFDTRYEGVKGHPYLFDENQNMWIYTLKMDSVFFPGNLNLDEREFVSIDSKSVRRVIPLQKVAYFRIGNVLWDEIKIEDEKYVVSELYKSKDFQILKSHEKTLQRADYSGAYASGKTKDEFIYKSSLWVRIGDKVEPFKMKTKRLAEVFGKPEKEIKKRVRASYLSLNNEEHHYEILNLLDEPN